jgi:IS5 family transposase
MENKVSIASTATTNIIVGIVSHESNLHDNHTLPEVVSHIESSRSKEVKHAVCDRGYRGRKKFGNTDVILPESPLKRDNRYQRDKKRKRCRRRATIEPIISHLKTDLRLSRNFLKGIAGENINLLMAAYAWNMAKWMREAILFLFALIFRPKRALMNAKKTFSPIERSNRTDWG